jgi:hypothetical protein
LLTQFRFTIYIIHGGACNYFLSKHYATQSTLCNKGTIPRTDPIRVLLTWTLYEPPFSKNNLHRFIVFMVFAHGISGSVKYSKTTLSILWVRKSGQLQCLPTPLYRSLIEGTKLTDLPPRITPYKEDEKNKVKPQHTTF